MPMPPHTSATADREQRALRLIREGRLQEAEAIYRDLIAAGTTSHATYGNLGAICGMTGRTAEVVDLLKVAINLNPHYPEGHTNLGNALKEQGNLRAAIVSYQKALRLQPGCPLTHFNLGVAHQEQGNLDAALACYRKALQLNPNYPEAHINLGIALKEKGKLAAAIASLKQALLLDPRSLAAHINLAIALKEQGALEAAITTYKQALQLKPDYAEAYINIGVAHQEQGNLEAAIGAFLQALQLKPDYAEAHWNHSLALLLSGDYQRGLEKYEWRFKKDTRPTIPHAVPDCPRWDGTPLTPNDHLLLVSEQGLGDTLQFMRYALHLRRQGMPVSICAQHQLHGLIQASGVDTHPLSPQEATAFSEGYWLPLLSLPLKLGVAPDNPIVTDPYIHTTQESKRKWKWILDQEVRPIIGINWQGNPETEKISHGGRSLPLEQFAPVAESRQGSLLSLQKGFGSEQLERCSFAHRFVSCQPQIDHTWDFVETAAIIANCDLVITTDTSVAHLAGGMGKPTWLLLKQIPDWRWGTEGERTIWYPSMRLFRQDKRGDWAGLLARVARELGSGPKPSAG